jgi:hypothetical protein
VVGVNDVKSLFIYSIDEVIPGNTVIKVSKKKDGTVLFALLGIILFII